MSEIGKTAIVADDEPITRMDVRAMLEEAGYTVVGEAADGFDAVELCKQLHPSVVLMDVKMPVFDGLSAATVILRDNLAGCVVLLTAYSDKELIERANLAGVTGYLVKPIEQRYLLPAIEVAYAQSARLKDSLQEKRKMFDRYEEAKTVNRAKGILAKLKSISETEAYRELQRLAMDKRKPLLEIANAVIARHCEREALQTAKAELMKMYGLSENEAYKKLAEIMKKCACTPEKALDIFKKEYLC